MDREPRRLGAAGCPTSVEALIQWLHARGNPDFKQPLFIALDQASYKHRLTGTGLYKLVLLICHGTAVDAESRLSRSVAFGAFHCLFLSVNGYFHQAIGISGKSSRLQQIFTWCLKTFNNAIAGALLNFPKKRNGSDRPLP